MTSAQRPAEPLADDFFRLCHDDRTGTLHLDEDAAKIGLASALLGELGWLRLISIEQGLLVVGSGRVPDDALTHAVFDDIRGEPEPRDVRTWLTYLATEAYGRVARRLTAGNFVLPRERRGLLRGTTVTYVPTDPDHFVWPRSRLSSWLAAQQPIGDRDVHLLGITAATGLLPMIAEYGGQQAITYFNHLFRSAHVDIQALVQETRTLIGNRVMARR